MVMRDMTSGAKSLAITQSPTRMYKPVHNWCEVIETQSTINRLQQPGDFLTTCENPPLPGARFAPTGALDGCVDRREK
jgi:hypothetical protein